MKERRVEPVAAQLLESMRSVGYSHETAIADLLDNSVTAGARHIDVRFPPGRPGYLAILDDGRGMTPDALVEAMRHGSRDSKEAIPNEDLGRFGLGLKTASLSQCRTLTVVTWRDATISACRWSVEHVVHARDWMLLELEESEIGELPCVDLLRRQGSGTLVLWHDLDRLAAGDNGDGAVLSERMDTVRQHLGLVFHRFLDGEALGEQVIISINGAPLVPVDPFLKHYKATQKGLPHTIDVDGVAVSVNAYTIPHISRLSRTEVELAGGADGLRRQQGFYIYRNKRLIIWGTWFRLLRQEELTKLTRIQVDIPNSLDHLWTLDIKKSAASPPREIRDRLRALLPQIVDRSRRVQTFRATKQTEHVTHPLWRREVFRDESVKYSIDRAHPAIEALRASLDDESGLRLSKVLRAIEESFPGEAFYNDRASERIGLKQSEASTAVEAETEVFLYDLGSQILDGLAENREAQRSLLSSLGQIDPFCAHSDLIPKVREKLADDYGLG